MRNAQTGSNHIYADPAPRLDLYSARSEPALRHNTIISV